jgi:hypothetical protein
MALNRDPGFHSLWTQNVARLEGVMQWSSRPSVYTRLDQRFQTVCIAGSSEESARRFG